jgi:hypothetical protein
MKKKNIFLIHQSIILLILTVFFTIIVFFIKNYYFWDTWKYIEENYIEPNIYSEEMKINSDIITNSGSISKIDEPISWKEITALIQNHYRSASPFYFEYFPESFERQAQWYTLKLSQFLQLPAIKYMVYDLKIELHKPLYDVRGKMKNKVLKLFWVSHMKSWEFLSVSIHEFWHYLDIYFLEKKVLEDLSQHFYDISWKETKVLRPGEVKSNFVSWYAMTNKYEDFAETFTYYILHNWDFVEKSKKSQILQKKYNFFQTFLFKKWAFVGTNFSKSNITRDYYRDITKIKIDLEKFLQYLKNWI